MIFTSLPMEGEEVKEPEKLAHGFDYDLFVIGGGSGGISAARHAAEAGKRVALADYVTPTPKGTTWGLGGTCVNVGCIPKKLFHYAATMHEMREDQMLAGIPVDTTAKHDWNKMVAAVTRHIKTLNWGYKTEMIRLNIKYYNQFASFVDPHTIKLEDANSSETVTADKIVIAVGSRPTY